MSFSVRVWGHRAAFIGAKRDEPMSFPVMTPSAARGIIEAILWKPAIVWRIIRIHVLSPLGRYFSVHVNELKIGGRTDLEGINIEAQRDQRCLVGLKDVDYVIECAFQMTDKAGPDDNHGKFTDMFRRRIEKGQNHARPYLGRRDFSAFFEPAPEGFKPHPSLAGKTINMGSLFYDFDYGPTIKPLYFQAELVDGTLVGKGLDRLPTLTEVTA